MVYRRSNPSSNYLLIRRRQGQDDSMSTIVTIALISWAAGLTAFVGGILAKIEGRAETPGKREFIHGVVAFGGGILIAAVAFAMVPYAIEELSPLSLAATFCLGGISFCILDARLSKRRGSKAQFMAMLIDFIPEAIALGALFGHDHRAGFLLAFFIGVQNLPEGFNSFRESMAGGLVNSRTILTALFAFSLLGPVAACIGHLFLQQHPTLTAGIMSFAGGGILYLIFQDIAPQSKMRRHWTPPLGAVLGFVVGMIGKQLLG
jgi:ZIP family zinc transporter